MSLSFSGPEHFYSADEATWWEAVDKALKGGSRAGLVGQSDDGFDIAPLYRDGQKPLRARCGLAVATGLSFSALI